MVVLSKGVTKQVVKQVVKAELKNLAVNTTESVLKQVNSSVKEGKTLKESIKKVDIKQAVADGAIANLASNVPNVLKTKSLEKNVKKLNNIAQNGRPRAAQTARAVAASKRLLIRETKNEVARESMENGGQNGKNKGNILGQ